MNIIVIQILGLLFLSSHKTVRNKTHYPCWNYKSPSVISNLENNQNIFGLKITIRMNDIIYGAVIALYFKKPGHFPMVVEKKAQIQWPWGFVLLIKYIMLGQFPTVKDFWPDKSPWSEDLKWISLSTTMGKCPFSIFEALCEVVMGTGFLTNWSS